MTKKYAHLSTMLFSLEDRVLTVKFNRPEVLNAFTLQMEEQLVEFLGICSFDDEVDVVVLTGEGRAFSAGGDVENWMTANIADPGSVNSDLSKQLVFSLIDFPKIMIAKVNGHAVGLGCTVALYCDVIFASNKAKIADPHVLMGLSAGDGGAIIWPQLIGYARAREYLMMGEFIPATKAAEIGLINYALPPEELDAAVDAFVQRVRKSAYVAVKATKQTVNLGLKQVASAVMDASIAYEKLTVYTKDHAEAVHAFLEGRPPVFQGK